MLFQGFCVGWMRGALIYDNSLSSRITWWFVQGTINLRISCDIVFFDKSWQSWLKKIVLLFWDTDLRAQVQYWLQEWGPLRGVLDPKFSLTQFSCKPTLNLHVLTYSSMWALCGHAQDPDTYNWVVYDMACFEEHTIQRHMCYNEFKLQLKISTPFLVQMSVQCKGSVWNETLTLFSYNFCISIPILINELTIFMIQNC